MSFLGGGRPRREDPELAAAARRRREAFAADIGDERGRAFAYEEPRRRRGRWTTIVGIALLLLAGIAVVPLLRSRDGGLLPADCDRAALAVSAGSVQAGGKASWQVAGPADVDYAVTLDAAKVRPVTTGLVSDTGRVLAGPFRLPDCRSTQTLFDAPAGPGRHDVRLFRRDASGWAAVAAQELKVS